MIYLPAAGAFFIAVAAACGSIIVAITGLSRWRAQRIQLSDTLSYLFGVAAINAGACIGALLELKLGAWVAAARCF